MKKNICVGTVYGVTNRMMEIDNNGMATEYIVDNYEKLVRAAEKMSVRSELCNDIVHDVFNSISRAEENGEGYDPNKGNISNYITVEEFVFGRLKKYSLNSKYRKNDGQSLEISASSCGEEIKDMNGAQIAYEMAASYDDIEAVELKIAFPEEFEYLLSFESDFSLDLRAFLKNLHKFAGLDIDKSVFNEVKEACKKSDFFESLQVVMQYSLQFPRQYEAFVANV